MQSGDDSATDRESQDLGRGCVTSGHTVREPHTVQRSDMVGKGVTVQLLSIGLLVSLLLGLFVIGGGVVIVPALAVFARLSAGLKPPDDCGPLRDRATHTVCNADIRLCAKHPCPVLFWLANWTIVRPGQLKLPLLSLPVEAS